MISPAELFSVSKKSLLLLLLLLLLAACGSVHAARLLPLEDGLYQVIYSVSTPSGYSSAVIRARLLEQDSADESQAVQVVVKLINIPQPVLRYWSEQSLTAAAEEIQTVRTAIKELERSALPASVSEVRNLQKRLYELTNQFRIPGDLFPTGPTSDALWEKIQDNADVQGEVHINELLDEARRTLETEVTALTQLCPDSTCFSTVQIVRPLAVLLQRDCQRFGTSLASYHLRTDVTDYALGRLEVAALPDQLSPAAAHAAVMEAKRDGCFAQRYRLSKLLDLRGVVFEFCDGGSLDDVMRLETGNTATRLERFLPVFSSLAFSLSHVHSRGVVWRDLKPQNILFCRGKPHLHDFGEAVFALPSGTSLRALDVAFAGTPPYYPPDTQPHSSPFGAFDTYGLGVVWYQMVYGWDTVTRFPMYAGKSYLANTEECADSHNRHWEAPFDTTALTSAWATTLPLRSSVRPSASFGWERLLVHGLLQCRGVAQWGEQLLKLQQTPSFEVCTNRQAQQSASQQPLPRMTPEQAAAVPVFPSPCRMSARDAYLVSLKMSNCLDVSVPNYPIELPKGMIVARHGVSWVPEPGTEDGQAQFLITRDHTLAKEVGPIADSRLPVEDSKPDLSIQDKIFLQQFSVYAQRRVLSVAHSRQYVKLMKSVVKQYRDFPTVMLPGSKMRGSVNNHCPPEVCPFQPAYCIAVETPSERHSLEDISRGYSAAVGRTYCTGDHTVYEAWSSILSEYLACLAPQPSWTVDKVGTPLLSIPHVKALQHVVNLGTATSGIP
eukprot:gnl/Hemi2/3885_TR1365_c0_g1_i1.p1 gnl/Hemi2/3885_TR1365_c0_g1~~gnl/Hemi2/3885_TR1365_c0_g1_i1.p1  ORF type:complete len:779 (-),score=130.11 gnl/Hemi2/3885_TR1365_c0_g1_i1:89-2425(-)